MRKPLIWLLCGLLALLLVALLALALAVDDAPRVPRRDDLSTADIDRAVALVRQHDPRRAPFGQLRSLSLSERELDLLVQQAARRWLGADTRVALQPGRLLLQASVPAPRGRWLNIELALRQTAALPQIDTLHVGRLPLPPALAPPLLRAAVARRGLQADALLELGTIERVTIAQQRLGVSYRIERDTTARLRAALVAPDDQQRLRVYNDHLATLTQALPDTSTSLARLMSPLFALAAERSAAGGDPVAENRCALLVLAFFANHRPLGSLLPAAYDWPRPQPLVVTLRERQDFALHFTISALLAAEAGTPLADVVGLWKEVNDARHGGSGFSFNDLAADRAGTRLGEMAVQEPLRLQRRIAAGVVDSDLLPRVDDLPEHLREADFVARYGGVGGAGYNRLLAQIEARLDALPLLR